MGRCLRIAMVNSFFPPWRGGAETYVFNLSKHLQRRGHEVTVICSNPPLNPSVHRVDGVTVKRLRLLTRIYGTPVTPGLPWTLAREKADIIHANFPSPYIASLSSAMSRSRKIPAVLTWHNDLPPVTTAARILVLTHDRLVLPSYLPQFSFIIATSETYAESSAILSRAKARVVVVRNGVDTVRFNPKVRPNEIRSRLNLDESKVVLFVGALTRWHRYKGLDVLIKSIALLKNAPSAPRLLVVGGGELLAEYVQLANELGIRDRVIFADNVPDHDLPKYYACSDLLAQPSKDRSEGFGLTILEANATGKPAIGTTVGGIPSVIRDGYNGLLVSPNDPKALADTIRKALADDGLLKQMGRNGRVFAEQHDWSIVAQQTENVYKRALAAH